MSWSSRKQNVVALSSCEAEYIFGCHAACQGVWLKELMKELGVVEDSPVLLKMDNTSAMNLAKNPVSHGRSKHIEVRYHFLRDMVTKGKIELIYCKTDYQLADLFTKALKFDRFEVLRKEIGALPLDNLI